MLSNNNLMPTVLQEHIKLIDIIWHLTTKDLNDTGHFDCDRMEEHDESVIPEVKIEIDVAEELPVLWMNQKHLQGE